MRKTSFLPVFLAVVLLLPYVEAGGDPDRFALLRERMVTDQIISRGVLSPRVLKAMREVPRHLFVPKALRALAYRDHPLPIGYGQTISQPYIVAFMSEALNLRPGERVLEVGTGSGYQAAVLSELGGEVYTIEIIEKLAKRAQKILDRLDYDKIRVKIGDGYKGWPEKAPFDAVIVTCAPETIPDPLVRQLKEGGRMIIPVGGQGTAQRLVGATKKKGRLEIREVMRVRFVPMVKGRP